MPISLIVEWLKKMEIALWIDQKLSPPHGNHEGMSYGQLSVLLLTYIITQSDHRLSAVEPWVQAHRKILELTTGWSIGKKDATDDRLGRVVEELGLQSEARQEIEVKLGRHLIRAYELPTEVARSDTTSFNVNHQQGESPEESLLRYGYSKDKRPDLLQYRQLLATLDPMGMPLVSATLSGNGADDPLYLPTWQQLVKVIGHKKFFKRGSLPALPIYFQNEDRITGLMFVLNIALRLFTLMEFVVRQALQQTQQSLAGLYDGNPKRKTNRPSAERMLQAFCHLTLYYLPDSTIFITPLSELQKQILSLMKMPESLYQLSAESCKT
ncbi:MAG: hypothetical protein V7K67_15375 [Nostoc sp.]|uniref:IS1634 family transposase n=1 Tax=Nostoc sp. TaxID=1180 RepID=UPI002FF6D00F